MNSIKVSIPALLDIVKKNRELHNTEYKEMIKEYKKELLIRVKKLLSIIESQDVEFTHSVARSEPKNNTKDYDRIISMLSMTIDTEINLSEMEYEQYVLDNWSWSGNFAISKTAYLK